MKKFAAAFVLASIALSASAAPERVGAIGEMSGMVTVGGDGFVGKAVTGTPLVEGSTVMVSSTGQAKLVLANGCTIQLKGSQYITINAKLGCDALQASAQKMMTPYRVTQVEGTVGPAAAGGAAVIAPVIGFAVVAGVATADRIANEGSTSGF